MNASSFSRVADRSLQACGRSQCLRRQFQPAFQRSITGNRNLATQVERDTDSMPRWKQTPPRMAMPVRLRQQPQGPAFIVNDKAKVLDEMYNKLLGRGGDAMLPEEVKWLAITHKSFDHGRRGSNDRLAFLGKRIVDLQSSLALLQMPQMSESESTTKHPALQGLENVSAFSKQQALAPRRISKLAQTYGLAKVMRWKPRKADNLKSSGLETVLAHTLYSIVGALALQRGGQAAVEMVRDRIIGPLGLRK